jgi:hypothetical protein
VSRYRVLLNGRNCLIERDEERRLMGFWTTRCVDAATADEARARAIDLIRIDPAFRALLNGPSDPQPVVLVDKIERVGWWDGRTDTPDLGFYIDRNERPLQ